MPEEQPREKSDSPPAFDPSDVKGVVVAWNEERGTGFAARPGEYDIFLHHAQFADGELELAVGDAINFEIGVDDKGRTIAKEIAFVTSRMALPEDSKGRRPKEPKEPKEPKVQKLPPRQTGVVEWFNNAKELGMSRGDKGQTALFNQSSINGTYTPREGDVFSYNTAVGRNGRPRATNMTYIEDK
eukprot:gene3868-12085_t